MIAWVLVAQAAELVRVEGEHMGTPWEVVVWADDVAAAQAGAEAALAEVARIEALVSSWRPEADLGRVNAAAGAEVAVSDETFGLLVRAVALCEATGGAFDPSFGPLGALWRWEEGFTVPGEAEIAEARALVDCERIQLDGGTVRLEPGMSVGLGATAKGYAVDRASALLVERGLGDHVVNGGGDLLARGDKGGAAWTTGVQHPRGELGELFAVISARDEAVVSSGDYARYVEHGGKRYGHVVDPRTGRPTEATVAVTVIAPSAELADGLATSLMVLGPEGVGLLGQHPEVEALLFFADGTTSMTEGMAARLGR